MVPRKEKVEVLRYLNTTYPPYKFEKKHVILKLSEPTDEYTDFVWSCHIFPEYDLMDNKWHVQLVNVESWTE